MGNNKQRKIDILENTVSKFAHAGVERYVISCILKHNDLIYEAQSIISTHDFLTEVNRNIYSILESLSRQNLTFDVVTILNEANGLGLSNYIGGAEYVTAVFNTETIEENFKIYLSKLRDSSVKYHLHETLEAAQAVVMDNAQSIETNKGSDELINLVQERVLDVALDSDKTKEPKKLDDGLEEYIQELRKKGPVNVLGMPTGFDILDRSLNGMRPGTLTVVAARPKRGKSMLLQNWATYVAFNGGDFGPSPILYIDTEMLFDEVRSRVLSHLSQVPERDIINGKFKDNQEHESRMGKASRIMSSGLFLHKYFPNFSAEAVSGIARKYKVKHGIRALFFDYIKLPEGSSLHDVKEHQLLGYLSVALKNIAGELEIPVITAVQIGRSGLIADSDRILRFANTILELRKKTDDEVMNDGIEKGNARLHVIDTRAGRFDDWDGIHLSINHPLITVRPTGHTYKTSELIAAAGGRKKI